MTPIPDSRRDADAASPDHLTPASIRLLGNRPLPKSPTPDSEGSAGFDSRLVLNSLKYHWFLFAVFGSLLAGGLGTAAWELLPAKYTTNAVLRVAATEAVRLDAKDAGGRADFLTYLKTQSVLIKNEYVLRAAMRDSRIGDTETLRKQDDPVKWLEDNLLVEFAENSEVMKLGLTGENPQDLADIVNAVQTAYMKEVVQKDLSKAKGNIDLLEDIQKIVEDRLQNQQKILESEKKRPADVATANPQLPVKTRIGTADFARMNEELRRLRTELEVAREREKDVVDKLAKVDAMEAPLTDLDTALTNDLKYKELTQTVESANKKADYLKATTVNPSRSADYHSELNKVAKAQESLDDYKRKIKIELSRSVQRSSRRELEQRLETAKDSSRGLELRVKSLELEIAQVEVAKENPLIKNVADVNPDETKLAETSSVYQQLLRKISTMIVETRTPVRVSVIQGASVPIKKEMKKQIFGTALAGLLGFVLVGACITLYESRVMRLFGSRDLNANSSMNLISTLPEISASEARVRNSNSAGSDPFMEAVDQVRVVLARNFFGKRAQSIVIASAQSGEGKTTLAGHLAVSMTKTDKKTIIVDGNLRQPGMHEHLGMSVQPGVCELLRGERQLNEVVQRTAIPNLSFLAAGVYDQQAQQAMGRDRMRRILDRLRQDYDTIIIDSHALMPVADTLLIGQHCDAILMCARRYISRKPLVEQSYQRVCELGVPHTGLIFMGEATK
jgi:capsular exopolysaccharide synthesis family protein